ncbi:hypothetical protein GA0115254_12557, partial [Streptomyces sp. Ncost-T10-10d]
MAPQWGAWPPGPVWLCAPCRSDDLGGVAAGEVNRTTNRLRGLLSQIHPSLERVLGPRLAYPYIQALLARHGSPARLKRLGRARCEALLKAHGSRKAHHLT